MNVTQGDGAGEDGMWVHWTSIPLAKRRGRNKQMIGAKKKQTPGTQRLSFSKENVGNVKHINMFTHLSVIQIFRLRLGPDVHQIPSNPRGMVWPNLPQSMWPRLESRGKRGNVCLYLCVLCISSCQQWTLSNAAALQATVSAITRTPSRGNGVTWNIIKTQTAGVFFFGLAQKLRIYYIIFWSIRGRHEPHQPIACIWWHHYDRPNQIPVHDDPALTQHERNRLECVSKQCGCKQLVL